VFYQKLLGKTKETMGITLVFPNWVTKKEDRIGVF
jgi:hypothetical protein